MKQLMIIAILLLSEQVCYGQTESITQYTNSNRESFIKLQESIIKSEIELFNKAGESIEKNDSLRKTKLVEILLKRCSNDFVYFEKGDIISIDKLITISSIKFDATDHILSFDDSTKKLIQIDNKPIWGTDGEIPTNKIEKVRLIFYKYPLILPDSAISGLYEPKFCVENKPNNKIGKNTISYCKAFQSIDCKRVYIYMINGEGVSRYEITWVIQDKKYYARIIDKVN